MTKSTGIFLRATPKDKSMIDSGAKRMKQSVTDYILNAVREFEHKGICPSCKRSLK